MRLLACLDHTEGLPPSSTPCSDKSVKDIAFFQLGSVQGAVTCTSSLIAVWLLVGDSGAPVWRCVLTHCPLESCPTYELSVLSVCVSCGGGGSFALAAGLNSPPSSLLSSSSPPSGFHHALLCDVYISEASIAAAANYGGDKRGTRKKRASADAQRRPDGVSNQSIIDLAEASCQSSGFVDLVHVQDTAVAWDRQGRLACVSLGRTLT